MKGWSAGGRVGASRVTSILSARTCVSAGSKTASSCRFAEVTPPHSATTWNPCSHAPARLELWSALPYLEVGGCMDVCARVSMYSCVSV